MQPYYQKIENLTERSDDPDWHQYFTVAVRHKREGPVIQQRLWN